MRAGRKQPAPGKTPAAEAPRKQKDAPVVGKIAPKTEPEDEIDDADDPTEDVTEDAADGGDGGDGDEGDDEPVVASPVFNDRRKRSSK